MFRFGRTFQMFYQNADGSGGAAGADNGQAAKQDDQAGRDGSFWESEAKKAFKVRDELKNRMRELESRVMSDEDRKLFDTLKTQQEKAEEERKRKEGEFDSWRAQAEKKHEAAMKAKDEAIAEREAKLSSGERDFDNLMIENAFSAASEWFGPLAKTHYNARAGQRIFAEFVEVEKTEDANGRISRRVVVKNPDGEIIRNTKTGQPESFALAIGELLAALPDKNEHLRGSGKPGSGNSGAGSGLEGAILDASKLTPEQRSDPKVIARLRQQRPKAGMVFGTAYNK
jgi:hypothetical protein